jgi:hypothetical protein
LLVSGDIFFKTTAALRKSDSSAHTGIITSPSACVLMERLHTWWSGKTRLRRWHDESICSYVVGLAVNALPTGNMIPRGVRVMPIPDTTFVATDHSDRIPLVELS